VAVGNDGVASEVPSPGEWSVQVVVAMSEVLGVMVTPAASVVAVDVFGLVRGRHTGVNKSGTDAGNGCALCVVVFSEGANAVASMAFGSMGQIPVLRKAAVMVFVVSAVSRALE
jgi:hypothetical protein